MQLSADTAQDRVPQRREFFPGVRLAGGAAGLVLLALFACDVGSRNAIPASGAAVDSVVDPPAAPRAAPAWRRVFTRDLRGWGAVPEPFAVQADSVRVILDLGPTVSTLTSGVLVVNLLTGESIVPIMSFRSERLPNDTLTVDTSMVRLPPGDFLLFVAEHRGLRDWRIAIDERVAR